MKNWLNWYYYNKKNINLIYFIDLLLSMFGQGKTTYPEMIVLAKVNANGIIEL